MTRPSYDRWFLDIAEVVSRRSTCIRRKVGAVVVSHDNRILTTGYNGVPSGLPHCIDSPCGGHIHKSGEGLDACIALHAEQNAIARLREPHEATTLYCTTGPCIMCTKLIMATPITRIVAGVPYALSGRELWESAGLEWEDFGH